MGDYTIRPYEPGDEASILRLFARAFGHRRDLAHWRWKYLDAPHGGPAVSVAVDEAGLVAAHYAGYPVRFRRGAESLLAYQIGDTMTAPAARGIGRRSTSLLARTARHFYEHRCAGRVAFNYGFNEGGIRTFSIRVLDACLVEPVAFRVRERTAGGRGAGGWRRLLGRLTVEPVEAVDESWDALFGDAAPAYGFLVERDRAHVRWRYLARPDVPYLVLALRRGRTLVGWAVFARRREALVWGDALVHPDHADGLGRLVDGALAHPIARGAERVQGWFSSRPAWFAARLDELGFRVEPEPQDLGLMCVPWQAPDAARWMGDELYYTYGDSDLF